MQDLIQTMSNGTNERTNADLQELGATAPGQALFNNNLPPINDN